MPWRAFLARAGAASGLFGLAMFAAIRLATADPGGPTRDALTYAGVLRMPPSTPTALVFEFSRPGATCSVTTSPVTFDSSGAFSVEVPIACSGAGAGGRTLFNGDGVTYTVRLGSASGELLTPIPVPITPVPYARFADQAGVNNDCPVGYESVTDSYFTRESGRRLCQKSRIDGAIRVVYDEVVRVGTGAGAFWVDRYEATVWQSSDGSRGFGDSPYIPFGTGTAPDYPVGFPANGQWAVPASPVSGVRIPTRLYALSRSEPSGATVTGRFTPSRFITWFQAQAACRASGKRLPHGDEWLEAAVGTDDGGGTSDGADGRCVTTGVSSVRGFNGRSGISRNCLSWWGAQDMIGNATEWTNEWYAGAGTGLSIDATSVPVTGGAGTVVIPAIRARLLNVENTSWPSDFGGDGTSNVNGTTLRLPGDSAAALPAAALRGGGRREGGQAGIFALDLRYAPSGFAEDIGFRCVVSR